MRYVMVFFKATKWLDMNNPRCNEETTHIVYNCLHTWYTIKNGNFIIKNHAIHNEKYHESET